MISDVIIKRVDLQGYYENIHWSDDGTLVVNTTGNLTILRPRYQKEPLKSANNLFEVQKLDIESWPRNKLFRASPQDEVVSTNFSSTDDFVSKLLWSPLTSNRQAFLAVLTASKSVHILQDGQVRFTLDNDDNLKSQAEVNEATPYTFEWLQSDQELYFITGHGSGNLRVYRFDEDGFTKLRSINLGINSPIVQIKAKMDALAAVSAENEIILLQKVLSEKNQEITTIKEKDRFLIYDLYLARHAVFFTTMSKFCKIDFQTRNLYEATTNIYEFSKIIPSGQNFLLVSNTTAAQVDQQLSMLNDDKVTSAISRRIKTWDSKFDSFRSKNSSLKIYGIDCNFSGNVLAILYEIDNDTGFKYKITSENFYKVAFVPLDNKFEKVGSSLAIYQEFLLTGRIPDTKNVTTLTTTNKEQTLGDYLKFNIPRDPTISKLIAQNIISRNQDSEIRSRYSRLLVDYIKQNGLSFDNCLDRTTYKYLLSTVGEEFKEAVGTIHIASDVFEESFNIDESNDSETLLSGTGHIWNRCALTFLPILSTNVKVDPVTQRRIIDISKDQLNGYGYFTKAILESLNEVSIYSGCRFESKP